MYPVDVVFIDYVGLLKGMDGEDQWRQLGRSAREAKLWAEKHQKIVVLLAQLSDDGVIRYSRAIREHSDNAWFWTCSEEDRKEGLITVKQAKARNQRAFDMVLEADFAHMSITDSHRVPEDESEEEDTNVVKLNEYLREAGR